MSYDKVSNEINNIRSYYIADWEVDSAANRLRRDTVEIKLESKVMAVLDYLASHAGQPVAREDLEKAIWGQTVVGYDALTRCIARLRKELGDDMRNPIYIETIPKKGYRLIAPITYAKQQAKQAQAGDNITASVKTTRTRLYWPVLIGFALIILLGLLLLRQPHDTDTKPAAVFVTDRPSIVVLPFSNLSQDPSQDYFSHGMTADITTALSKLSGLFVIAQQSAMNYEKSDSDIYKIAKTLGVRYVVQGSIQRTKQRLRINVHLVDTSSSVYLWSEKYDRALVSVFDIQDEIATKIVSALSITLTETEKQRTAHQYTTSIEAYDDFLRGQAHYIRYTIEDNKIARRYYQQAIYRDASFARAYGAMALTYTSAHRRGWEEDGIILLDKALELAQQAVELDSELPQAHWVLSYVYLFRQEFNKSAAAVDRVIALEPNFADAYLTLAMTKIRFGNAEQAVELVRKAMALNPDYPAAYVSVLGQAHFALQEYQQAIPILREAIERNLNLVIPHLFLIASLGKLERNEEAQWAAEQLKSVAPNFHIEQVDSMLPIRDEKLIFEIRQQLSRAGI